ncbi:PorT family protein [Hymenobacter taeanensis]|uniref:PorT family protein n=1 Tax=Hymenobacter taeanensis TaxID=2735321 RepID=A0A6M6BGT3_9BACT|nr:MULTISPECIES: porin family protein [Hymenobacter]QJX47202.1 PorT family protein [Hymenobacter taeanensis]UOQ81119.1 PorT family protein [Hymenobacter sp. 5414T-23]
MKKIFLSGLLLTGLASTVQAQSDVSLGLKVGGSLSSFSGEQASGYKSIVGYHAGVFANIGLTRMFAFQPELLYSRKGAKLSGADFTTHLDYVDVPLVFHVNANGLFFEAGPQVGFLIAAKNKTSNITTDVKNGYNTVDAGYVFGLGYQRKTGLGIGLRYNGGFTNVEKSVLVGSTKVQNNIRNSVFQLYLTYSLNGR